MSLFAMDSRVHWNDGIAVRGSQQNGSTAGRHHSRTSAAWRQAATALVRDFRRDGERYGAFVGGRRPRLTPPSVNNNALPLAAAVFMRVLPVA